jgi:signal transduction histidine kinase
MSHLIDDLLNLSRVSRAQFSRHSVDVSALATEIVDSLRSQEPDRHVTVSIQPGMRAKADTDLVKILLGNLIGNAWKFTARCEDATIHIDAALDREQMVFRVKDNGAGFDMQYASRLFNPFQRLHREKDFPGTGIGLSIASRIVARHGGRIWPESEPDHGATFHFTLEGDHGALPWIMA